MKIKEKIYEIFKNNPTSIYNTSEIESILKWFFPWITKTHFNLSDYINTKYSPEVFLTRVCRWHYQYLENSNLKKMKTIKVKEIKVNIWTGSYLKKIKESLDTITLEEVNWLKEDVFLDWFLKYSKNDLISLESFIQNYRDNWIHDFNFEILVNYHKILDKYQSERLYLYKDFFILNDRGIRVYVLNNSFLSTDYFNILVSALKNWKIKRILSSVPLNLDKELLKNIKEGIEDEVCSNLIETFDRNSYDSWKKYNKKVVQALNLKDRVELRDITEADFNLVEEINEKWAKYKLEVQQVHWISFPRGRYKNSAKNLVKYKELLTWKIFNKLVLVDWVPYWFTSYTIHWDKAYEHGYVSLYFDETFHIDNSLLKNFFFSELLKEGVVIVNSWFALNKKLREFKTIHTKGWSYVNKYVYTKK